MNNCELLERVNTLKAMFQIITQLNNGDAFYEWLRNAYNEDSPTNEDFLYIAEHDDCMIECEKAFCEIIARYGEDGFYYNAH